MSSRREAMTKTCWDLRAHVLISLALVLCLSSFTACADKFRVSEERQRQLQEEKGRVHCSRSRSRTVRAIVSEYLMPFVKDQKYTLPKTCRLHPDNDVYHEQEENMIELRPMQWQCGYCKKIFRNQGFLDLHFDNRHSEKLEPSSNSCLADACGALHCDYYNSLSSKPQIQATCKLAVVEKNRHSCEVLANTCFPADHSPAAQRLNHFFKRQFCDAHTCKKKLKIFPSGSGINRNKSLIYALTLFTVIVLAIFYAILYLIKRDTNLLRKGLRRASFRPPCKVQKE
ncbi:uncharacterized protein [Physcomitrium patens]|uniref:C2H2-type domain-containing protein n=2 Tax=Physcomitrium patens TaxID=3218 RepID=A0A7I4BYX3_PHYPA|nr:uncharacterized protein LOC112272993 [Physcomitrium patens]|eukprot:XP_024357038.1 uncharacterized protein LOC112272993 [Physcomitrella patens]